MQLIDSEEVQKRLTKWQNEDLYMHQEMTTGAYASHPASTFVKNAKIRYSLGTIAGEGPYRVGLKMEDGWVYAQGLTHWDFTDNHQLILAGHDDKGRLVVCLMLSKEPF